MRRVTLFDGDGGEVKLCVWHALSGTVYLQLEESADRPLLIKFTEIDGLISELQRLRDEAKANKQ